MIGFVGVATPDRVPCADRGWWLRLGLMLLRWAAHQGCSWSGYVKITQCVGFVASGSGYGAVVAVMVRRMCGGRWVTASRSLFVVKYR